MSFFRKTILSHFTFYAIFNIKKNNIEKCPFTYWLNGRWFLQIVDRDSWNLYPLYPLFPCSDFVSQMWGSQWLGGGGGGCNVFLTFYAIYNLSRINFFFEKTNYFNVLHVFFVFFFYAGNIEKCPFTYWLNGVVVYPNSRYREF